MADCAGWLGKLLGHSYSPRYSRTEKDRNMNARLRGFDSAEDLRRVATLVDNTYYGDVCTRCGDVRNINHSEK